jgi:hypothetical protein
MSDEIFFDGVQYISAADAAEFSGFTRDYVALLCRHKKVDGRRVGRNWYVSERSLKAFILQQQYDREQRRNELTKARVREYETAQTNAPQRPQQSVGAMAAMAKKDKEVYIRRIETGGSDADAGAHAARARDARARGAAELHKQMLRAALAGGGKALDTVTRISHAPAGATEAALRAIHVPVYVMSPMTEFMHKLVALTVAFVLTFGSYAAVDPEFARFAIRSMLDSRDTVSESYMEITGGGMRALARRTSDVLVASAENPGAAVAAAGASLGSFSELLANLARGVNTGVNEFVYTVAFPAGLIETNTNATVAIEIAPYARPQRTAGNEQRVESSGQRTDNEESGSEGQGTSRTTIVNRPVIERVIERERIVAAGGISEEYINERLAVLEQSFLNRLAVQTVASTPPASGGLQNQIVLSQKIDRLASVDIENSTISGGTISGAEISDATITGSSFAGSVAATTLSASDTSTLATTTISGDLSVSGDFTVSGASSTISSTNAIFTNSTTTNATTTNFFATNASTTNSTSTNLYSSSLIAGNATSTNLFATLSNFTTSVIATLTATVANITGLTATNATTTNATTTNLAVTNLTSFTAPTAPYFTATSTTATSTFAGYLAIGTTTPSDTSFFTIGTSSPLFFVDNLSGSIGIGTASPDASAVFQIDSTSKGFLPPRMTTAQKDAIASAAAGLTVFDSSLNKLNVYNGSAWKNVGSTEIGGEVTDGTQGSVLFIGDGDILAQDNANFNFSTSTNRLLLSQASSTRLSVFSNAYFGGTATSSFDSTGFLTLPSGFLSQASSTIGDGTQAGGLTVSGGATTTLLHTFSSGFLSLASSTIGSGTQAGGLTVSGGATTTGNLIVQGSATSTFAGGSIFGSNRLVILQNGNIGIGTAAPTTGFDVGVNTRVTGDFTVGGGSSILFSNTGPINQTGTGQVTFAGNVDAINGLDVTTSNFTVGGSKFTVVPGSGNTSIAGTLGVTGAVNASSTLQATGASRFYSTLWAGGAFTAAAAGTGLSVTNNASIGGTLGVTGAGTFSSGLTISSGTLSAATTTLTGELSLGSKKITSVASPTSDQDAANKSYVDSVAQGLSLKDSVRAGTTANITLSGEQTIDDVALSVGDRVLVKDQSDTTKNGIYVVASGSWSRATDADTDAEVTSGMFTFVSEGTINANSGWVLTTANPITLGTSLLEFTQFSGAGQIIAGTGIAKSGNTLDVGGTADRITANADTIDIASTYVGQSSIVTVGTLTNGALGSGFGAISIGSSPITAGEATFSSIVGSAITGSGNLTINGEGTFSNGLTVSGGTFSAATTTFSGDVALGGKKITGLADPTSAQEAATKAYVDAIAQGLTVKASVQAATIADITLSGEQTVDGVSLTSGDRILVKDQSTGSQNGIYVVAAGAWSRSSDADENSEVTQGMYVFVEDGTQQANTSWSLITADPITVDTTALTFSQFSGSAEVTAGDGLTKTGNTLNIGGTSGRITVSADSIDIANTYTGQGSIVTVGTLTAGSIGSGFGTINIGANALTAGAGTFSSLVDFGSLSIGGTATTTIQGNSATSTFSGGVSLAAGNVNVASNYGFYINNVLALSGTTLGANVVNSSLTSVGPLSGGSITTGFGAINIGADTLDAGDTTLANLSVTGSATSSQLAATSLTSGRVPFITTGGRFLDSSAFTFNNALSRLTATYASTTALSVSGNAYFPGSGIWNSSGQVGIGTTTPSQKLHVYGAGGDGTTRAIIQDTGANSQAIVRLTNDARSYDIKIDGANQSDDSFKIYDATAAADRFVINSSGNVGIGTTTPWGKLSITGTAGQANPLFQVASSTDSPFFTITNLGSVGIGASTLDASALLQLDSTSQGFLPPRMTTAQKNAIASAAAGLTIFDSSLNKLNVYNGSAWKNVGSTEIGGEVTNGTLGSVLFIGDGDILAQDNANFTFSTSTNRLLVTQASSTRLSVFGTSYFGGTATTTIDSTGAITVTSTSRSTFPYASSTALSVSGTGYFGAASTTNLTVSSLTSGRVPYITTDGAFTDSANLTFDGTTLTANTLVLTTDLSVANGGTGASTLTGLLQGNGTSAITGITGTAGQFPYYNSTDTLLATSTIFLATSGTVGIGTTTPWSKLSITSPAQQDGSLSLFSVASTTGARIFDIFGNGRVGIGTTNPGSIFTVQNNYGSGNSSLFAVASSTSSDGSTSADFFTVDSDGLSSFGDSTGTGDASIQIASDTNAWSIGYRSSDKAFAIASSTNLSGTPAVVIAKDGDVTFTGSGGTCTIDGSGACTSDLRLKTNVATTTGAEALAKLASIDAVTYNWKDLNLDQSQRVGVIAQQVQTAFPQLVGTAQVEFEGKESTYYTVNYAGLTAPLIAGVNELNRNLSTIASTSASTTPASESFAQSFFHNIFERVREWLASTANGLGSVFARAFHASDEICVDDQCLTRDDVAQLLALSSGQAAAVGTAVPAASNAPLSITIHGNNPANVDLGTSYADLGASASTTDDALKALGVRTYQGGQEVASVSIDTSEAATHTVEYRVLDGEGNVLASAARTVVVGSPGATVDEEETEDSGQETATSTPSAPESDEAETGTTETSTPSASTTPESSILSDASMTPETIPTDAATSTLDATTASSTSSDN